MKTVKYRENTKYRDISIEDEEVSLKKNKPILMNKGSNIFQKVKKVFASLFKV